MNENQTFFSLLQSGRYLLRFHKGEEWIFAIADHGQSVEIKTRPLFSEDYSVRKVPLDEFGRMLKEDPVFKDHSERFSIAGRGVVATG